MRADEGAHLALSNALAANSTLATVYHFRAQLRELWTNARLSRETQLDVLHEWCRRAEATGIEGLKIFADGLRGYSMVQRGSDQ
ncbi:MAG: DesA/ISL3 alpha bundle tail domain-containing protein [Gammaproteobacteria bacterium]